MKHDKLPHLRLQNPEKICLVIGDPIAGSLSPYLHNALFAQMNLSEEFLCLSARVTPQELAHAITGFRAMNFHTLICTHPHKTKILEFVDHIDEKAKKIGATNTIINQNGQLIAYNTDWIGIIEAIEQYRPLTNARVAIIGAGGTAQAALFGLSQRSIQRCALFNRHLSKAQKLTQLYHCEAFSLDQIDLIPQFDIIIHTTPIGMQGSPYEHWPSLIPRSLLRSHHLVLDAVYRPMMTPLLKTASLQGAQIVHGWEMFLHQAAAQFALYTQQNPPIPFMKKLLLSHFRSPKMTNNDN